MCTYYVYSILGASTAGFVELSCIILLVFPTPYASTQFNYNVFQEGGC